MTKIVTKNYETVGEYLADLARPEKGVSQNSQDTGRRDFFWTDTYADAGKLFTSGWADGVARVNKHREGLAAFLDAAKTCKSKTFGWDVVGDFIDVGRVLSGEPECCGQEFDNGDTVARKVVSIRLNQCVSGAVSADAIAARGVAVLVAVDLLESCGIRCEVICSTATKGHGLHLTANVTAKRANEIVDPDRLAFTVAHPSFFRRFGFRWMELYGHSPSNCHPAAVDDYGTREGTVEIDEILSAVNLSAESLKSNVIKIAEKCGLSFDDEQIAELVKS